MRPSLKSTALKSITVKSTAVVKGVFAACLVSTLIACGGSGGGDGDAFADNPTPTPTVAATPTPSPTPDATATPTVTPTPTATPTPTPTPTPEPATLAQIQNQIFTPICSECHTGAGAPQGLRLDSLTNSFNLLVNVASGEVPTLMRVTPNNPDDSYLVRKVEGGPSIVGGRMPLGRAPLSAAQIGMIRSWITAGAMQSAGVVTSTKVFGTQVSKAQNAKVYALQTSAELDASTLSEQAVLVYLVNGDTKTLANPGDVQVQSIGNMLNVMYSGDTRNADSIELQLNNPLVSSVLDIYGRQLDGNGDGSDGGVYTFVDRL